MATAQQIPAQLVGASGQMVDGPAAGIVLTPNASYDQLVNGQKPAQANPRVALFYRFVCGLGTLGLMGTFAIAVAALAISLRLYQPDILLANTAANPSGYIFGGAVHQGSGTWVTNKPKLPEPRSDLCTVAVQTTVYILGGVSNSSVVTNTVWGFDALRESYAPLQPMPVPRYRHAAAAIGDLVYVVGGLTVKDADPVASMDVYDVSSDTWKASSSVAPMSVARSDLAAVAFSGKLYVFGGYAPGFDMTLSGKLVEEYNPITNTWRRLADMPTARGDLMAVTRGNRIWVLGGWRDDDASRGAGGDFQAAIEAFDPSSNSWTVGANMLARKGDAAVAVYRGVIISVGGESWSGKFEPCAWDTTLTCKINQVPTHDTVTFIPDVDPPTRADASGLGGLVSEVGSNGARGVWVSHAPMPGARFRFAAAAVDAAQALYVFGGQTAGNQVLDTVTAFYDTYHAQVYMHYKDTQSWSWWR